MSGLAHYFEGEGVATTTVALLRHHAEQIKPPRCLWVPFELGRPLGPPNAPEFQTLVIRQALNLLDATAGPVLEDFVQDPPAEDDTAVTIDGDGFGDAHDLLAEVAGLKAHYEAAREHRGYSTVGLTGLPIEIVADYLWRFSAGQTPANPHGSLVDVQVLRFGADDLKAYYLEAATAGRKSSSSRALTTWFWHHTVAAKTLFKIRERCAAATENDLQLAKNWLIPHTQIEALGKTS